MGLFGSPTAMVGCCPVLRKSSLVTRGTLRSRATGPGPDGGGEKSAITEIQLTPGLGAKSVGNEGAADNGVAPAQTRPAKIRTAPSMRGFATAIPFRNKGQKPGSEYLFCDFCAREFQRGPLKRPKIPKGSGSFATASRAAVRTFSICITLSMRWARNFQVSAWPSLESESQYTKVAP